MNFLMHIPLGQVFFFFAAAAAKSLQSCLTLATPWTVARQTPLSMGFSRQEYWSGLPFPSPGDLPDPEIEPESPVPPALAGRFFLPLSHLGSCRAHS